MAGQFPTLAITKQAIDVEGIIVSLVFIAETTVSRASYESSPRD